MESGIRTNEPINSLSDLKGMKIRMGGLMAGKILQEFGGTPVSIAIAELYEALRRGTLDGAEYSIPVYDKEFHIEEITKYWLTPGWHQTSSVNGIIMNKKAFDALPEKYKLIVRTASEATMLWMYSRLPYLSAEATAYFKEYGIQTTSLSEEELAQIEAVKNSLQQELAAQNPDYAKVLKSQIEYQKMFAEYREAQGDFGFGRNPENYPDIE
jgi:TRAP-type mannitol/chloroaromatic compound transport system substrate-binding protein